ncbi:MAG TPA: isoprenylcysteine carboxylmethyltransferase family protein [Acidobacteriaceae bacterium]
MRSTALDFRLRFFILGIIIALGFWAPWCSSLGWTRTTTWLALSSLLYRSGWLTFSAATNTVLLVAIALLALAAWLRLWASAYVGAGVVQSQRMHSHTLLADGPYRRTRNPLYLGLLLHTFGLAILMPPSGAIFCVVLVWLFQIRLALAEESFLSAQLGDTYRAYRARVPRFLPAPTPQVPSGGAHPRWLQGMLGEIYVLGAVITFAVFGWGLNSNTLIRGILISLGISIVVRALLPRPQAVPEVPAAQ